MDYLLLIFNVLSRYFTELLNAFEAAKNMLCPLLLSVDLPLEPAVVFAPNPYQLHTLHMCQGSEF